MNRPDVRRTLRRSNPLILLAVGILAGALLTGIVKSPGRPSSATAVGTGGAGAGSSASGGSGVGGDGSASQPGVTVAGAASSPSGATGVGGSGAADTAGSGAQTGGSGQPAIAARAGTGAAAGQAAGCPGSAATGVQGVTATTIKIGFALPNLGVLAAVVNIGNPQADIQAVLSGMTKDGRLPICGRHIVPDFQTFNVLDPSQSRAACDNFAQDKDFAVISLFGFAAASCVTQENHMVDLDPGQTVTNSDFAATPLLFTSDPPMDQELRDTAYWAVASGELNGKSIGVYYNQNGPGGADPPGDLVKSDLVDVLAKLGHPVKDVVVSNTSLSASTPTAADPNDTIAIEKFKTDGIQVVFPLEFSMNFFNQAAAQLYHAQWMVYSTAMASDSVTSTAPSSLDGALGLLWEQVGEQASGMPVTAQAKQCFKYYTDAGLGQPPAVDSAAGQTLRESCDPVDLMVRALTAAGLDLTSDRLVGGMRTVQSAPESYFSNQTFSAVKAWGASQNQSVQWHSACSCWKISQPFTRLYAP